MEFDLNQAREILERTPRTLSALLSGLSDAWLDGNEGDDTFSARDVLGHLVSGEEDDWLVRTEIVLQHGVSKPFATFDRFSFRDKYAHVTASELLDLFQRLRSRNLERLGELELGRSELALQGTHPELGVVTLRQLLATWVSHDLAHLRQIARVLAKQYRDEVGPWREYMRVMEE